MQAQQTKHAYDLFVEARSLYTGQTETDIRSTVSEEEFERQIRQLHEQWMHGEFSFGKFTEHAQIAHLELWEILDALGLQIHR
jgi:hypothetical protein